MLDFTRFETLTFDCYGTLIDWETGILRAVRPVIERHGVEARDRAILETYAKLETEFETGEYKRYETVLRHVMDGLGRRFGFNVSAGERDCLVSSLGEWRPFPDTVGALRRLKKRYTLAVVSNVDDHLFAVTARVLEVPFDFVVTAERVRAYKPSDAVFSRALREIGCPRERILHVAQSVYHDIIPAKAIGLATVWINRGLGKDGWGATPPASAEPDLEVPDLETLADLAGV
jgi:2-haloacid dehalogenase